VIDSAAVERAFVDSLFREDEVVDGVPTSEPVPAEGILVTVGFHRERLESHRAEVAGWLADLPDQFRAKGGGGWSFLNACDDRDGVQWTGLHQRMERLFQLGIGLGIARWLLPRDMWDAMPGGMPYVVVDVP
jgi:hypothetical protein